MPQLPAPSPCPSLPALMPGVLLCSGVGLAALALQSLEERLFGQAWLEALVLAILIGVAVRSAWTPGRRWAAGTDFSAKTLLEVAVMLLGASIDPATVLAAGPGLVAGIAGVVVLALAVSYGIGRLLGLPPRMAMLVACGNSICGNSAIAATAPVIGADGDDVAAAIAFTAVLGVLVVLGLPLLVPLLGLSAMQYGVFAGLTVYAVPQILAATAPIGALSVQVGTLVKLLRVLMLGPVVVALALMAKPGGDAGGGAGGSGRSRPPLRRLVPWFILGFLALAGLRAAGVIPEAALTASRTAAGVLTVLSMAALGLGVDVRMLSRAGLRVTAAAVLSLAALGVIGLGLIRLLGIM
ncbi:YeiH family protein [Azospirillum isscasi]|uniref:Sulfate exporter family transporter n=1 Tax=Azospirillum isscasi TaxID=3053926 RepID=A0ABU0WHE8_9PROT|nr:putative sulfate exporter family transporter [Azospirillum isscasi]MDQ2103625.1 putative sulfate exporter family transporter [Azospirillum isscasi]